MKQKREPEKLSLHYFYPKNASLTWQPYTVLDTVATGNYECPDVNNYRYLYLEMAYSSGTRVESRLIPIPRWKAVQVAYSLSTYYGGTGRELVARYIDDTHMAIDCTTTALNWIRVMLVNY